jgi:hypothetical protein
MKDEKLFYLGTFGETLSEPETSEMVKEAEMFSTGTHRGVTYTEDDLNELVTNFNAEEDVPVQLDHSESARDTVGYIQGASVKDGKLMGKVKIIDEYAQERINKGLMKKLSVSFYLKHTEAGFKPHKIREVSLVAFPQVKGARLFSENGYVSEYEEQPKGGNEMTQEEIKALREELRKEVEAEVHSDFSEVQDKAEKFTELQKQFKEQQVSTKVEKFQADSKVIPAQADSLKALLLSFSEEQAQLFEDFMSNAGSVDFSEQGEFEDEDNQEDKRSQEQKDFDAFYEEHAKKFGMSL